MLYPHLLQANRSIAADSCAIPHPAKPLQLCCCHCGNGLPLGTEYTICTICETEFCQTCRQETHPSDHRQDQYIITSHPSALDTSFDPVPCTDCSKLVHAHIKCGASDCDFKVCFSCFQHFLQKHRKHEHSIWTAVQLPHRSTSKKCGLDCQACKEASSYDHCTRCLRGIREGDPSYECKNCLRIFDETGAVFCEPCFDAASAEETADQHHFIKFQYQLATDHDDEYSGLKCLECDNVWTTWDISTIARHAHGKWEISLGSLKAEELRGRAFRICPQRRVQDQLSVPEDDKHGNDVGCYFCHRKFQKEEEAQYCPICNLISCHECNAKERIRHVHPTMSIRLIQRDLPSDFWRELVNSQRTPDRTCNGCHSRFYSSATRFLNCAQCMSWEFCETCIQESKVSVQNIKHDCAGGSANLSSFLYMDVNDKDIDSERWLHGQLELAWKEENSRKHSVSQNVIPIGAVPAGISTLPRVNETLEHAVVHPTVVRSYTFPSAIGAAPGPMQAPLDSNELVGPPMPGHANPYFSSPIQYQSPNMAQSPILSQSPTQLHPGASTSTLHQYTPPISPPSSYVSSPAPAAPRPKGSVARKPLPSAAAKPVPAVAPTPISPLYEPPVYEVSPPLPRRPRGSLSRIVSAPASTHIRSLSKAITNAQSRITPERQQKIKRTSIGVGKFALAVGVGVVKGIVGADLNALNNGGDSGGGGGDSGGGDGGGGLQPDLSGPSPLDLQSQDMAAVQGLQDSTWGSVGGAATGWNAQ